MSPSTLLSLNQIPVELLYRIFCYLDIPDILRIRRVSQYLNGVSCCREVWSDAYRKAEFVRRPGPFLSQSAHDLENALVSSFRFDRNLRFSGERPTVKLREIRYTGADLGVSLVFGRYLLIAFSQEVRCYDLNLDAFNSNSGGNTIHRSTGGTLKSFHCASAIDMEGCPFACVVLSEETQTAMQISIYSLNVQSEVTRMDLLHQFERSAFAFPAVSLGPRVIVVMGRDVEAWDIVVLDVHTRTQFLFPSFTNAFSQAVETAEQDVIDGVSLPTSISTSTHLLLAKSFRTKAAGWSSFFQAFALPPPHTHHRPAPTSIPLSLSHSDILPCMLVGHTDTVLLHDAVIDPSTQDVLIVIRVVTFERSPVPTWSAVSKYGILRLSTPPTSHGKVGTIAFQPLGSLGRPCKTPFHAPSFDGTGRTIYMQVRVSCHIASALEYYDLGAKCRGNDDGGRVAKVVEYPCILRLPTSPRRTLLDYDPYSGRICFRYTMTMPESRVIEIFDLGA